MRTPAAAKQKAAGKPPRRDRAALTRLALLVALAAGIAVVVGAVVLTAEGDPHLWDTDIYRGYGDRMTAGQLPYRDFAVEYPPLALVTFIVPSLLSTGQGGFDAWFQGLMVGFLTIASVLIVLSLHVLGATTRRTLLSLAGLWGGTLLLGPFITTRYDFFAAAVTLGATCAILYRRTYLGPALLGISIATKLYSAVLVPLLFVRTLRLEGRAAALRALAVTVASAALVYLPFFVLAPAGVVKSVWRQAGRGLEIQSLGSGVLLALHQAFGLHVTWTNSGGAQNLTGTDATIALAVTTIAGIAALLLVWWLFSHGDAASGASFAQYAAAATVAFVAFGKVLSPQFLVWLLAAVALVLGRRGVIAMALLVVACALTRGWFPWHYVSFVQTVDPTSSWLVFARDMVLVTVFATLVLPPALPSLRQARERRRGAVLAPTLRSRSTRRPARGRA